jgi:hypothetical protein
VGADATEIVHEPRGSITDGQSFEVTTNPLLAVGGARITESSPEALLTLTFAGWLSWPTTWLENESVVGLALSVAKTGLGDAVGVAVEVVVLDAVGVGEALGVAVAVLVAVAVVVAVGVGVGAPLPPGNNPNTASCVCVPI